MLSFFGARASTTALAGFCRRMHQQLEAGIDIRRVLERESGSLAPTRMRRELEKLSEAVQAGGGLAEAMNDAGEYFPAVTRELVAVGEHSGKLPAVFRHLAENYEEQLRMRRAFLQAIAWPMIELTLALGVIGFVILVSGMLPIPESSGQHFDMLGLGLVGQSGFIRYCLYLLLGVVLVWVFMRAKSRGIGWTRPVQRIVMRLPVLGKQLTLLALARLTWAMHLVLDTDLSLLKAIPLCFQSSHNAVFIDHTDEVVANVRRGRDIHFSLRATGAFPDEFVDAVQVAEESGSLPESMRLLSAQYQERAQAAMAILGRLAAVGVWILVAAVIILAIFRLFMRVYVQPYRDALNL